MNTYFIDGGENLKDLDRLNEIFLKRGNWKPYERDEIIDFMFLKSNRDERYWNKKSLFNNSIKDLRKFFNKSVIAQRLREYDPDLKKFTFFSKIIDIKDPRVAMEVKNLF